MHTDENLDSTLCSVPEVEQPREIYKNWSCDINGDYLEEAYLKMILYLNLITHNLSYQFLVHSSITNIYIHPIK